jgi:tRNA threonylcarbamoyladenosine biosynthesis protein TsaB
MKPYLAIETATRFGSVALGEGGLPISEAALSVEGRQGAAILPAVQFLLQQSGLAMRDVSGIVVGAGPGSFTGVRIAAATARGLVRALGIPLYAYSSLAAAAACAAMADRPVCAMFDAKRGEVYAACYRFAGMRRCETIMEPVVAPVSEIVTRLRDVAPLYTGEGAERYFDELPQDVRLPAALTIPRAAALLWLAAVDPQAGRVVDPSAWEPNYVRAPGAERGVRG